ncbi:MAG: DUF6677 family protein [Planctomycetaceae bacterium]
MKTEYPYNLAASHQTTLPAQCAGNMDSRPGYGNCLGISLFDSRCRKTPWLQHLLHPRPHANRHRGPENPLAGGPALLGDPRAGQIYQKRYFKGILFLVCILGMFGLGINMGKGDPST